MGLNYDLVKNVKQIKTNLETSLSRYIVDRQLIEEQISHLDIMISVLEDSENKGKTI